MRQTKSNKIADYFQFTGIRYWTASLLPATIGTTLPFWLCRPDFEFRIADALLFLILTFFAHVGFSLLYVGFWRKLNSKFNKKPLFIFGIICLMTCFLIGLYINSSLNLHPNVPDYIFIVYGITAAFVGVLYIMPPFMFYQRLFGELVISVGLGMIPLLGAYLVQAGDITRTVYLASLPVVCSTALWVWIIELINYEDDKKRGYKTTVMYFNYRFSSRIITFLLILSIYISLVMGVYARPSLHPFSLIALISILFGILIIKKVWNHNGNRKILQDAEKYAFLIHLFICLSIILASLSSLFSV